MRLIHSLMMPLLLAGCNREGPLNVSVASAVVQGAVTAAGQPVADALVTATGYEQTRCPVGDRKFLDDLTFDVRTGADGRYRVNVAIARGPGPGCVRVTVTPPPQSGLAARSVEYGPVVFRTGSGTPTAVEVDVAF